MKEYQNNGRIRYTYGGVVFIYCPRQNRAVTSWKTNDASETSGTKVSIPILLDKYEGGVDDEAHDKIAGMMNVNSQTRAMWKSHSVLIVDLSGSMRKDDVNGARCRSDGVWMALARDYVKKPGILLTSYQSWS